MTVSAKQPNDCIAVCKTPKPSAVVVTVPLITFAPHELRENFSSSFDVFDFWKIPVEPLSSLFILKREVGVVFLSLFFFLACLLPCDCFRSSCVFFFFPPVIRSVCVFSVEFKFRVVSDPSYVLFCLYDDH